MSRTVIVTTALLAAVAAGFAALTASAAPAGSAPPCIPKLIKVKGQPIVYECGPATGTLHVEGKTYTYRNGLCQRSKTAGLALELDLGTLAATANGNAGKPYLSINIAKIGGTVSGYYGGKQVANNLVSVTGHFPGQGTFKSKYSGAGFGTTFSGSWNCHGVVWQTP